MVFYDAIIVGAGPAGSTAAKNLAKKGINVILLDKAKFPRDKVCAGGLTNTCIELHPEFEKYCSNRYSAVKIFADGYPYPLIYHRKNGFGFQTTREYFDHMLIQDAIQAGATFKENQKVIDILIGSDTVQVKTETDVFESKIVLGADGTNSVVSRKTGINPVWEPNQIGSQIRIQVELPEEVIKEFFGEDYTVLFHGRYKNTPGIAYVFPKRYHINIGICTCSPDTIPLKKLLIEFVEEYQKKGLLPPFKINNIGGSIYPVSGPLKRIIAKRILLLGDAAGFVNPFDGEGIYTATYSADIAAEVILEAIKKNDFSEKFLQTYQNRCMDAFGNYLHHSVALSRISWKNAVPFVKYAPYSNIVVKLYRKAVTNHQHVYWTFFKMAICFLGAMVKYYLDRTHKEMPIVEI